MTNIDLGNLYRTKFVTRKPRRFSTLPDYYEHMSKSHIQVHMVDLFLFLEHKKYLDMQRKMFYELYKSPSKGRIFKYETTGHII